MYIQFGKKHSKKYPAESKRDWFTSFFSSFFGCKKRNHSKDVSFFNPENIADMPGLLSANLMVVCTNYVKFDSVGEA